MEVIVRNEVLDGMFTFYDSTRATLNVCTRYVLCTFVDLFCLSCLINIPLIQYLTVWMGILKCQMYFAGR